MKIFDKIKQNKQLQKEMFSYLLVGLLGTVVDFLVFYFAMYLGVVKFLAQLLASLTGFSHNHIWQHYKVFNHNQNFKKTYFISIIMFVISVLLSAPLLVLIDNVVQMTWFSKLVVIGINTVILFVVRKKFVFIHTK